MRGAPFPETARSPESAMGAVKVVAITFWNRRGTIRVRVPVE